MVSHVYDRGDRGTQETIRPIDTLLGLGILGIPELPRHSMNVLSRSDM